MIWWDKWVGASHNLVDPEPLLILQAHDSMKTKLFVRVEDVVNDAFEVKTEKKKKI